MSQLQPFLTSDQLPPSRNRGSWGKTVVGVIVVLLIAGMAYGAVNLVRGSGGGEATAAASASATAEAKKLVITEGLRLSETVNVAAEDTGIPKSEYQLALQTPNKLGLPQWAKGRPEGFLFPATYDVSGNENASEVLGRMVKRFNQASADLDLENLARKRGMTPYQVLTIASILQAEVAPQDFEKVARVIVNRLNKGMPLQLDSTVNYVLGIRESVLNEDQLATKSEYNTYLVEGLPPTPINSPGSEAIQAALNPAKGNWLYFVTIDPATQQTKFTNSYSQFLKYKERFLANVQKSS